MRKLLEVLSSSVFCSRIFVFTQGFAQAVLMSERCFFVFSMLSSLCFSALELVRGWVYERISWTKPTTARVCHTRRVGWGSERVRDCCVLSSSGLPPSCCVGLGVFQDKELTPCQVTCLESRSSIFPVFFCITGVRHLPRAEVSGDSRIATSLLRATCLQFSWRSECFC